MKEEFNREAMIIGEDAVSKLEGKHVAVFGIGGVGGFVCEALVRAGIGELTFIDRDVVDITNINRQIVALHSTIGKNKTEVMKQRALDINPSVRINTYNMFFLPETKDEIDFARFDYVVDCVDTVTGKICIIESAKAANVPVISSMGTGNKLDPKRFEVCDISKTSVCPLAKVMRKELKQRGIFDVKVVYSKEEPVDVGSRTCGSISFVPSSAGLFIAGEVIKDLLKK